MKKTLLVVLDGWGIGKEEKGNAIIHASPKNFNDFLKYPNTKLLASGQSVGLPSRQIGGSEVGHLHLGSGRVVLQELMLINKSIESGVFSKKKEILSAFANVRKKKTNLHVMGLLSDGGVHSHINHLFSLLEMAKKNKVSQVYIHVFLDGRDVPPKSAEKYLKLLKRKTDFLGIGKVATISGRYYAMDRDNRWQRIKKVYESMVLGYSKSYDDEFSLLLDAYSRGENDEFVMPGRITGAPLICDGDSLLFFNFRSDRSRQITQMFVDSKFDKFSLSVKPKVFFVALTNYDANLNLNVVMKPTIPAHIFPEIISSLGLKQLRIAETEKYAHVTYFFNAGRNGVFSGENRILVPSPRVSTYDLKPHMSAFGVMKKTCLAMKKSCDDFILVNFANADMVGHTGNFDATVNAVSYVDKCLGQVVDSAIFNEYLPIITADHGNAEVMMQKDGSAHTAHTLNKVPFIVVNESRIRLKAGALFNVAPTLLKSMNISKSKEMDYSLF
ncbi:2,3-bisphosphoglycerate-independent phosphoglycerate mutase [archaeon]|nr:2,3-bisphosphoglycerate-independent phosphoglycerate mutase [archaeon]